MTFVIKVRGASSQPIVAEYMCPEHGRFDVTVARDANGDPPSEHPCPGLWGADECGRAALWVISAPHTRVQKVTAVTRGKWQKPEHKTWTDTRNIAEGQPLYEWKEDRAKIWEEKRKEDVMRFAKEHHERPIGGD